MGTSGRRRSDVGPEVAVTGVGPVSAVGIGREPFWRSLEVGRPGFGPVRRFDPAGLASRICAEVGDLRLGELVPGGRAMEARAPRCSQLALCAAGLALDDAALDHDPERIGVVVGTSVGNLEETLGSAARDAAGEPPAPHQAFYLFSHSAACLVAATWDLRGPVLTVSTGCNSTFDALGVASLMLSSGQADAMLVVGADSELCPEIYRAMEASGSLATRYNDSPERASRPFDRGRDGNVLGEGAGALVLERLEDASKRGASPWCLLRGQIVRATGRGRRYSARSPERAVEPTLHCLGTLLDEVGWAEEDVDVFNANGSSSVLYDDLEARTLQRLFRDRGCEPAVHSVKSMLGQHGAGSTALQLIATCLTLSRQVIPPTINHDQPEASCEGLRIVTRAERGAIRNVLAHAIGFGGFYTSAAAFSAA